MLDSIENVRQCQKQLKRKVVSERLTKRSIDETKVKAGRMDWKQKSMQMYFSLQILFFIISFECLWPFAPSTFTRIVLFPPCCHYRELAIIWFYYFYFRCVVRSAKSRATCDDVWTNQKSVRRPRLWLGYFSCCCCCLRIRLTWLVD